MTYPKILRNTVISGISIFLIFVLFKFLDDPNATRTIDSISSTRSTLLFIFGFFLPGFLFGLAVTSGMPALKKGSSNKVIYIILCGILYIGLVFPSFTSATRTLVLSGIGSVICVLFVHLLLTKIKMLAFFLFLAFLGGVAAILPLYLGLSESGLTDELKDKMPLVTLLVFPIWHILTGGIIARSAAAIKS